MKIYDESDRCPMCHKQPDEATFDCEMCSGETVEKVVKEVLKKKTCKEVTIEKMQHEFKSVVEPVIKWMNENCHPHHTILITHTHAELLEGEMAHHTEKYLVD